VDVVIGEKKCGIDDGYLTGIACIGWQKLGVVRKRLKVGFGVQKVVYDG